MAANSSAMETNLARERDDYARSEPFHLKLPVRIIRRGGIWQMCKSGALKLAFSAMAFLACSLCAPVYAQGPAGTSPAAGRSGSGQQSALVAQGKGRFQAYKCYDCHGNNGEGTPDAPDLTHSKLTAEQVSKFLQKPSVDADNKGMPDVPTDSPDHKPLVAYVMSLRAK